MSNTSHFFSFFNLVHSGKDDYNRKLGLNTKKKGRYNEGDRSSMRKRKGYAYRYTLDDDDNDDGDKYNLDTVNKKGEEVREKSKEGFKFDRKMEYDDSDDDNDQIGNVELPNQSNPADSKIIDVEATVPNEYLKSTDGKRKDRQGKQQQSWEERAQKYEQVPPSNVKAWGPDGVIDGGIDIRTYAARNALEEISKARKVFEKKEEMVNMAENDLIQLKR